MIYISKLGEVEAVQFKVIEEKKCKFGVHKDYNSAEICRFIGLEFINTNFDKKGAYILVETGKGVLRADIGDYIVNIGGNFYPLSESDFHDRYAINEIEPEAE
jgi:hypothetical protein